MNIIVKIIVLGILSYAKIIFVILHCRSRYGTCFLTEMKLPILSISERNKNKMKKLKKKLLNQNKVLKEAEKLVVKLVRSGISDETIAATLGILTALAELNEQAMKRSVNDLLSLLEEKGAEPPENDIVWLITSSLAHMIVDEWNSQEDQKINNNFKNKRNVTKKI